MTVAVTLPRNPAFPSAEEKEKERRDKREAVLRTAAAMFCRNGYTATQMGDVAAELGVTKPTLYYYFKSKEDVLVACFQVGLAKIGQILDEAGRAPTAAERLRRVLYAYAELMGDDFGKCTVRIPIADFSWESRDKVRRTKRRIDETIRTLVKAAVEDGSIAPCDPKIAAFTILGSLNGIGIWHQADGPLAASEIAHMVVDQLFRGLDRR